MQLVKTVSTSLRFNYTQKPLKFTQSTSKHCSTEDLHTTSQDSLNLQFKTIQRRSKLTQPMHLLITTKQSAWIEWATMMKLLIASQLQQTWKMINLIFTIIEDLLIGKSVITKWRQMIIQKLLNQIQNILKLIITERSAGKNKAKFTRLKMTIKKLLLYKQKTQQPYITQGQSERKLVVTDFHSHFKTSTRSSKQILVMRQHTMAEAWFQTD